jgi:hypothetical protein
MLWMLHCILLYLVWKQARKMKAKHFGTWEIHPAAGKVPQYNKEYNRQ